MVSTLLLEKDDVIKVHTDDFDMALEYQRLRQLNANNGAVVLFVGLVRDFNQHNQVKGLFLEHYPAMTELALTNIVHQAKSKWPLGNVTVIHRIGHLHANDQIVMVGVTSQHRHAAFSGAEFIIDFLKVNAPFWKKELTDSGDIWVEAKSADNDAVLSWSN
jgi:molybdopterin synthase catalytic subunit